MKETSHILRTTLELSEGAGLMDIAGAKALKERLRSDEEGEPQPVRAAVDASANALPVFQWLGVSPPESQAPTIEG
jgi:hypothetical protein